MSNENQVGVGDLRVGADQALEGDLVVLSDGGEGVARDDDVESWASEDGGCGCFDLFGEAGRVVCDADLGGDGEDFA